MRFVVVFAVSALLCAGGDLEQRIEALSSSVPGRGVAGIDVVDAATGKPVYRRNQDKLFLPASNMKLFTSALALVRLGPDYRFVTNVIREASGDLVLVGSGDPSLSGRVFPYQKDARMGPSLQAIDALADQIVASGVTRVDGDIVGDDRLYPWTPYPPSWTQDDAVFDSGAPVSALSVNDNAITIAIRPGRRSGDRVTLSIDPPLEYYTIDNRVTTIARGGDAKLRISRLPGSRQVLLWGSVVAAGPELRATVAIDDPALFAAYALDDALTRRGVVVTGGPVARHRTVADDYFPAAGTIVASRTSPPLLLLLQTMDKVSENLFAEMILREVGRVARHSGTREDGLAELNGFLAELGASKDEARLEDGSGLSRNALVTPALIARLLVYMNGTARRDDWLSLLPAGGEDGTLEHRLCCFSEGRGIRAKTGSLARSIALSGYADSGAHGRLAFSILVNDFSAPAAEVRQWIDKIALALTD